MHTCEYEGCGWRAIAPSTEAASERYAEHLVTAHSESVEADIPPGKVAVRTREDERWRLVTLEEAKRLHGRRHDDPT